MSTSGPSTALSTPEKKLTSRIKDHLDSPESYRIDCIPDTKGKLLPLGRKASNIYLENASKMEVWQVIPA